MSEHLMIETATNVTTVRIHRPEKKNALTAAMYSGLAGALDEAAERDDVRVVVITGSDDTFTAGNDIADFLQSPPSDESSPVFRFLRTLVHFPKPIVVAVNGVAIGIGTTMLLHCDLVYAGERARFGLPFVNLALVPEAGSSLILPQLAGHRRAAELLMLGNPFDAATALAAGIVTAVVADADAYPTAAKAAAQLAAKPPAALRLTKQLLKRGSQEAILDAMAVEAHHFAACLRSPEAQEAFQAFLERRPPDFTRFQ